jgi:hypothetical protein
MGRYQILKNINAPKENDKFCLKCPEYGAACLYPPSNLSGCKKVRENYEELEEALLFKFDVTDIGDTI